MRISVFGLGRMGAPMAANLIELGHDVSLYDSAPDRAIQVAAAKGKGRAAHTVPEAVHEAQVALTMLEDDEAEMSLAWGKDGLLECLPSGAIHLCMSTIGVQTSRSLARAHAEAGHGYVAAPVFGRPGGVSSRQLWVVTGGPEKQVARCITVFDALARGVTQVGPRAELAHALKLGGDVLKTALVEALAEVLAYGEKSGMEPAEYLRLLNTALFRSPLVDTLGGLMVRHTDDSGDLGLASALRDIGSAIQASEEVGAIMPMAELLQERLEQAAAPDGSARSLIALSRACRRAAGLEDAEAEEGPRAMDPRAAPSKCSGHLDEREVLPDPDDITHFESRGNCVLAWAHGKCYRTPWTHLGEVERAYSHIPFQRLHRHILVGPNAHLATNVPSLFFEEQEASEAAPIPNEASQGTPAPDSRQESTGTSSFPARNAAGQVQLDLAETSHFEEKEGEVWAWARGKRYRTSWKDLGEVEGAFHHLFLLRVQRHILLLPTAVQSIEPIFGGRVKARVAGGLELMVSRYATPRLKELLGM